MSLITALLLARTYLDGHYLIIKGCWELKPKGLSAGKQMLCFVLILDLNPSPQGQQFSAVERTLPSAGGQIETNFITYLLCALVLKVRALGCQGLEENQTLTLQSRREAYSL